MSTKIFILLIVAAVLPPSIFGFPNPDNWYKSGNFYQIYPRSFKDSDNDGIGDLNGITSKLNHLKDIGVDGVWLSPIFKLDSDYRRTMADFGYDISDFYAIQPEYGTMEDFERLAAKCEELGIRLILDFVPNHSSDEHEWFKESVNREPGFEDFYVWHPGKFNNETGERSPPTNWVASFRYSMWEWNEQRQQYYLHQFAVQQPDLNYRNPKVVEAMKDVLRFWLGKGVSGFRCDAVTTLFEVAPDADGNYPDEPLSGNCDDPDDQCYLDRIYTTDQEENFDMVYQYRETLDEFRKQNGGDYRILMTEAYTTFERLFRYYGDGVRNGSEIPFNFYFLNNLNKSSTASDYKYLVETYLNAIPDGYEGNWVLGNHDQKRLPNRLGGNRVDLYNILLKTLPGISISYNGEEIGMTDVIISWEDTVDPSGCNTNETIYHTKSRDPARTPMQWDGSKNAGFNEGKKPWLPISTNYKCVNVKTEREQRRSHLHVYKRLVKLREEASLGDASYEAAVLGDVYTYKRQSDSRKPIVVALNFGDNWQTIDVASEYGLPNNMKVVVASIESQYTEGQIVDASRLTIPGDIGIVLTPV